MIELEDGRSALKLTTASYRRPNGKNIHQFPGAKYSDEWGVMPDKGFEVKLSDGELTTIQERWSHDFVTPPPAKAVAAAKSPAPAKSKEPPPSPDRQLQAAVKYLSTELAKAR